ncbi:GGDEF domain-containing protein [Pelagibacterium montanilacus]|uniref:GGDEF domain-containing protein n=1 Tax=Pelagibacterium montanilacus TaxID=2185280 RepID=UPI000F8CB5FF|nr:GGDEF domain-containing protein [Pelagibacterium montanilacus]
MSQENTRRSRKLSTGGDESRSAARPPANPEHVDRLVSLRTGAERDFILDALDESAIVAITDVKGTIIYVNRKFSEISGYCTNELIGQNHRILNSGRHSKQFFRNMYRTIARGTIWSGEICNARKDGSHYWVHTTIVPRIGTNGNATSYVAIRFDITESKLVQTKLRENRRRLRDAVRRDALTGVSNRAHFTATLGAYLKQSQLDGGRFALAFVDVDNFKFINDSYRHDAGDAVLRTLAQRLETFAGGQGLVARLGGDEFAALLPCTSQAAAAAQLTDLMRSIRQPMRLPRGTLQCTVSVGLVLAPRHGKTGKTLMKAADLGAVDISRHP